MVTVTKSVSANNLFSIAKVWRLMVRKSAKLRCPQNVLSTKFGFLDPPREGRIEKGSFGGFFGEFLYFPQILPLPTG